MSRANILIDIVYKQVIHFKTQKHFLQIKLCPQSSSNMEPLYYIECKCLTCQWKLANICVLHTSSLARAVVINLELSVECYDYTVFMSICENNTANADKYKP